MIGIAQRRQHGLRLARGPRKAVGPRKQRRQRKGIQRQVQSIRPGLQPAVLEGNAGQRHAIMAEGMEIAVAGPRPVHELDPQLEARPGGRHEGRFVQADQLVEPVDGRDGRLADADGADLVRFQKHDLHRPPQQPRQGRRRHPSGRPAAKDDKAGNARRGHALGHRVQDPSTSSGSSAPRCSTYPVKKPMAIVCKSSITAKPAPASPARLASTAMFIASTRAQSSLGPPSGLPRASLGPSSGRTWLARCTSGPIRSHRGSSSDLGCRLQKPAAARGLQAVGG
jgi:hypothetical protein